MPNDTHIKNVSSDSMLNIGCERMSHSDTYETLLLEIRRCSLDLDLKHQKRVVLADR